MSVTETADHLTLDARPVSWRALRLVVFTLASLCFVCTALAQAPPTDAQRAEARLRYENGARKYDLAKYDEAAHDFEAAYQLSGAPEILYNIAQSLRLAGNYERALLFYRNYLRRKEDAPNRSEVERRIDELQGKVREQQRQADQQRQARELEEARAKAEREAQHAAAAPSDTPVAVPHETAPKPPPRWLKYVGGVAVGVGVAGIGVGVGMSLAARSASTDVQNAAAMHQAFDPSLEQRQNMGHTYDVAAIACYAVGGVLAAGGAIALGLGLRKVETPASATLRPIVGFNGGGLALEGRF